MEIQVQQDNIYESVPIQIAAKILGSDVKVVSVKSTPESQPANPKGELAHLSRKEGNAVGLLEIVKALSPSAPILGSNDAAQKEAVKLLKLLSTDLLPQFKANDQRWVGKLHKLNKDLLPNVFFLGQQLSVVDLAFFPLFHSALKGWSDNDRIVFGNITRWFDFLQHHEAVAGSLPLIPINKNLVAEPSESKTRAAKPKEAATAVSDGKTEINKPADNKTAETKPADNKTAQKKTAQPAKPAQPKGGKAPEEKKPVDVSRLEIRVGKIVAVKKHEEADTLYVEQIDLGEQKGPRTVVSGLVKYVPIEQMQDRMVVVICNLKPAKLKGILSEAMVLAASNGDHTQVELLDPPTGSKIGERVSFEGYPGEHDVQLNPKHKIWEEVQPGFMTTEDGTAVWKGIPFKTTAGTIKVKSITNGTIK